MFSKSAYNRWKSMMGRCYDPKHHKYELYGARGITVCRSWHVFAIYYFDVGDAPPGLQFDRVNNDGNYEPGNWRWATSQEQNLNKRVYRAGTFGTITLNGVPISRAKAAKLLGTTRSAVQKRIAKGRMSLCL